MLFIFNGLLAQQNLLEGKLKVNDIENKVDRIFFQLLSNTICGIIGGIMLCPNLEN